MKYKNDLEKNAKLMVTPGKGILAADESSGTIAKRLEQINVESSFENRLAYRDMLFTTTDLNKYISGVILFDETIRQTLYNGNSVPDYLYQQGILPGIKVDKGTQPFALHNKEFITNGLDGLSARLKEYNELGAKFAKWRAVIKIENNLPSEACIYANAHALARYAAICQDNGIVPIVEPEVLMNGSHTIEKCYDVTKLTQEVVFDELTKLDVMLEGIILKPSMVISGDICESQAEPDLVAEMTVKCLKATVPANVPGCAFLSGGQSDVDATVHLNLMNKKYDLPWNLTFSYGRALQHPAIMSWKGMKENVKTSQEILFHRSMVNGLASMGEYNSSMEDKVS